MKIFFSVSSLYTLGKKKVYLLDQRLSIFIIIKFKILRYVRLRC